MAEFWFGLMPWKSQPRRLAVNFEVTRCFNRYLDIRITHTLLLQHYCSHDGWFSPNDLISPKADSQYRSVLLTCYKVIATSPRMRNKGVKRAFGVENNTIGARRAARIDLEGRQDWELVPRRSRREAEALVVVVLMRIVSRSCTLWSAWGVKRTESI